MNYIEIDRLVQEQEGLISRLNNGEFNSITRVCDISRRLCELYESGIERREEDDLPRM